MHLDPGHCDVADMSVFFTKNGEYLGVVQSYLPEMNWYPTIGLGTKYEMVTINFGPDPFMFQIDFRNQKIGFNESLLVTNVGRFLPEIDGFVMHARMIFVLIAFQKDEIFIHYFFVMICRNLKIKFI